MKYDPLLLLTLRTQPKCVSISQPNSAYNIVDKFMPSSRHSHSPHGTTIINVLLLTWHDPVECFRSRNRRAEQDPSAVRFTCKTQRPNFRSSDCYDIILRSEYIVTYRNIRDVRGVRLLCSTLVPAHNQNILSPLQNTILSVRGSCDLIDGLPLLVYSASTLKP